MISLFLSLITAFGGIGAHVVDCHSGKWCHGTAYAVMPFNSNPYQQVSIKGWPPDFQPIIVTPVRGVTKQVIEQAQYGDARR